MANTAISALSAMAAWASGDLLPIVDVSDTTQGAGGSTKKTTIQDLMTVFTGSTTLTGATVTTSKPLLDFAQTWNAGGVTFAALKLNVTATASAADSLLMDLGAGGTTKFDVRKDGVVGVRGKIIYLTDSGFTDTIRSINANYTSAGMSFGNVLSVLNNGINIIGASIPLTFNGANGALGDMGIARNAANILEINNGTVGTYRDLKLRNLIPGATLATTMTDGFVNIPGAAGAVTGVPNNTTGFPMYYDSTNNKIYVYNGSWRSTAALT